MSTILNVEIKARCTDPDHVRAVLDEYNADHKGTDHQVDTYYKVPDGRLKLRRGDIENNLIYYNRADQDGPKTSDIHLVPVEAPKEIEALLIHALGVKVVVDKQREIYFIDNVKFHLDRVEGLDGWFVEIEAIDEDGTIGQKVLRNQCEHYLELFEIEEEDLIATSYSDMLAGR